MSKLIRESSEFPEWRKLGSGKLAEVGTQREFVSASLVTKSMISRNFSHKQLIRTTSVPANFFLDKWILCRDRRQFQLVSRRFREFGRTRLSGYNIGCNSNWNDYRQTDGGRADYANTCKLEVSIRLCRFR